MKNNETHQRISELITSVQILKEELEFLQDRKSKIKVDLFYDKENQKLLDELEKINSHNIDINKEINNLNKELMALLKDDKKSNT